MLSLVVAALLLQQKIETDAGCAKCHESQADDWKPSVHALNGVGCVACHGVDSVTEKSKPHLFLDGFRRGTRRGSPALCAGCHKKEFAAYDASAHAEDTRDPSGRGKGCSSCHAFHETAVADPRAILKENCLGCHKAGSEAIRFGEHYLEIADGFKVAKPAVLRIEQHHASEAGLRSIAERLAAYNRSDRGPGRPPWLWVVPAVPAAAALILWLRSGSRRRSA